MKADFAQILMPKGTPASESSDQLVVPSGQVQGEESTPPPIITKMKRIKNSSPSSSSGIKLLLGFLILLVLGLFVINALFLAKYEDKMDQYEEKLDFYEDRISTLESDLDKLIKNLMPDPYDAEEDLEYGTHPGHLDDLVGEDDDYSHSTEEEEEDDHIHDTDIFHGSSSSSKPKEFKGHGHDDHNNNIDDGSQEGDFTVKVGNHENHEFGHVQLEEKNVKNKSGRSKRQIPFPTVPTFGPEVERSKDGVPIIDESYLATTGVTLNPRYQRQPQTTEEFKLYDRIQGSRQLESTGNYPPVLPHHQISAAWSEPRRSGRIQLKSGDSTGADENNDDDEDLTEYSRRPSRRYSSSSRDYRGFTTSSNNPASSSGSNILISTASGGSSGGTYHRNSRVPTTGDYLPSTTSGSQTRSSWSRQRSGSSYGTLQKLGDGEVLARVVQPDDDKDDLDNFATSNLGQSGAEAYSTKYRYQGQGQGGRRRSQQSGSLDSSSPGQGGITSHAQTQTYSSSRVGSSSSSGGSGGHRRRYHQESRNGFSDQEDHHDPDSGDDLSIVKAHAWVEAPKPLAGHWVADVSNYTTAHKHYDGNGRLRNADGIFEAWRPADWMKPNGNDDGTKNFVLSSNGVLTVKKAGLYFVYAQIHYLDEHDINGFNVTVNAQPFLQCTTMSETYGPINKSNSCYTGGITYLKENDRIVIRDIETHRYSIFKPEKSFFGLMKVGAVP